MRTADLWRRLRIVGAVACRKLAVGWTAGPSDRKPWQCTPKRHFPGFWSSQDAQDPSPYWPPDRDFCLFTHSDIVEPIMSQQILNLVEQPFLKANVDKFDIGDTVDVHTKIQEGVKERIQIFSGTVIAKSGSGTREMFVVRRIVGGEGVERKFPLHSPRIALLLA